MTFVMSLWKTLSLSPGTGLRLPNHNWPTQHVNAVLGGMPSARGVSKRGWEARAQGLIWMWGGTFKTHVMVKNKNYLSGRLTRSTSSNRVQWGKDLLQKYWGQRLLSVIKRTFTIYSLTFFMDLKLIFQNRTSLYEHKWFLLFCIFANSW